MPAHRRFAPCDKLRDYEEAVRRAGAEVRVLDRAVDRPADVIRSVDGLLLPGGGDVLPSIYGEAAHPTYSTRPSRAATTTSSSWRDERSKPTFRCSQSAAASRC